MHGNQVIEDAISTLKQAILGSSEDATKDGLSNALVLIERGIPDLTGALSTVISALDDASSVVDKSEDEEYAYQAELESGRAALLRAESFTFDPAFAFDNDLLFGRFVRIMDTGKGDARGVYTKMLGEGRDAIMAEIVVYSVTEGFSRAAGNPAGNYMRFHEHLHLNVGADLPEGLTADALYEEAAAIADGDDMNGFSVEKMENFAMVKGAELHERISREADRVVRM
jgi:hypothetical protein